MKVFRVVITNSNQVGRYLPGHTYKLCLASIQLIEYVYITHAIKFITAYTMLNLSTYNQVSTSLSACVIFKYLPTYL